jgi:hypothetical protein
LREEGASVDLKSLWNLGFGSINVLTIIVSHLPSTGAAAVISNALVANTPQLILTLIYFTYNSVFTSMWMAAEWDSFSQRRKGLRVSQQPTGTQRSTYFLQLPHRVAVPLMVTCGLLHWLVSQSMFLVNVEGYWWDNDTGDYTQSEVPGVNSSDFNRISCGFSPMPILFVILIGIGMLVMAIFIGSLPLRLGMPLAGSCSFVISACCHPEADEVEEGKVALKQLQWGVTSVRASGIGHCSFSSREVLEPEEGAAYM